MSRGTVRWALGAGLAALALTATACGGDEGATVQGVKLIEKGALTSCTADARAKFVHAILAKPPAQKPGTFVYSNAGYMIAGAMLEAKSGKRWEQLMRTELFAKLGEHTALRSR